MSPTRLSAIVAVVLLLGCQAGAPSVPTDASPQPSPSPTPRPTALASPTPDPREAFLARVEADDFQAEATFSGIHRLGEGLQFQVEGEFRIVGWDWQERFDILGPGYKGSQQITVGQTIFRTDGDGPWIIDADPIPQSLVQLIREISDVSVAGDVRVGGQTLTRLRLTRPAPVPDLMGWDIFGGGYELRVELLVDDDGTIHSMEVLIEAPEGPPFLELTATFDRTPNEAAIRRPNDFWKLYQIESSYIIAAPIVWGFRDKADDIGDEFVQPDGEALVRVFVNPDVDMDLEEWAIDGSAYYRESYSATFETVEEISVGRHDLTAILSVWHGELGGRPRYMLIAATTLGTKAADVLWFSKPGNEAADRKQFDLFLTTFELAP